MKFPPAAAPLPEQRTLEEQLVQPPSRTPVPFDVSSVSATAATVFTVPSGELYQIDKILIHNPNASAHDVEIWVVPDGGTRGAANKIWEQSISASETMYANFIEGLLLGEGVALDCQAAAAGGDTLNLFVSCTRVESGW